MATPTGGGDFLQRLALAEIRDSNRAPSSSRAPSSNRQGKPSAREEGRIHFHPAVGWVVKEAVIQVVNLSLKMAVDLQPLALQAVTVRAL